MRELRRAGREGSEGTARGWERAPSGDTAEMAGAPCRGQRRSRPAPHGAGAPGIPLLPAARGQGRAGTEQAASAAPPCRPWSSRSVSGCARPQSSPVSCAECQGCRAFSLSSFRGWQRSGKETWKMSENFSHVCGGEGLHRIPDRRTVD